MIADPAVRDRLLAELRAIESKIEWHNPSDQLVNLTQEERDDWNTLLTLLYSD